MNHNNDDISVEEFEKELADIYKKWGDDLQLAVIVLPSKAAAMHKYIHERSQLYMEHVENTSTSQH